MHRIIGNPIVLKLETDVSIVYKKMGFDDLELIKYLFIHPATA